MTAPIVEALTASPLWSLVRHRFGSRVDRALVFLAPEGGDRVAPPHGARTSPYPRPSLAAVRRREFDRVYWVSLVEHEAHVTLADRSAAKWPTTTPQRAVTWWVRDPVTVVRLRLTAHDVPAWIAYDLTRRDGPGADDEEYEVDEAGIAYRLRPQAPVPAVTLTTGPTPPGAWGEEQQAVYRFYRQVLAEGPQGLAALWLLHFPEQARDVLDWTVHNRGWLTEQVAWEHELVGLLHGLEGDDRRFIGVKLGEILSDIGVPQADDVLRMLEKEGDV